MLVGVLDTDEGEVPWGEASGVAKVNLAVDLRSVGL